MTDLWDGVVRLRTATLAELASLHGGHVRGEGAVPLGRFVPVMTAQAGDLAPVVSGRFVAAAVLARARGASLLITEELSKDPRLANVDGWVHPDASLAMADVLEARATVPDLPATLGPGTVVGPHAVLHPRVRIGARVHIGASCVIGAAGFGWVPGEDGLPRAVPQLGGVIIEDDVYLGALSTIDAGTLSPTIIRRGAKLDAHVHVGHNSVIGEAAIVAAQVGFAGSVTVGRGVRIGGQAGIADHVTLGDGARVAARSGVIGDVPAGVVVAGYPAVPRMRWLRAFARLYKLLPEDPT